MKFPILSVADQKLQENNQIIHVFVLNVIAMPNNIYFTPQVVHVAAPLLADDIQNVSKVYFPPNLLLSTIPS